MTKTGVISSFKGEYEFLSNFHQGRFDWRGVEFASGEHAFTYAKTFYAEADVDAEWYQKQILTANSPGQAKAFGRQIRIDVSAWDKYKVQCMREIAHAKFSTNEHNIVGPLINTGAMLLVEGNTWGDTFWGRAQVGGKWTGFNTLGTILMEERGYWLHSDLKGTQ